jgi:hypothetical protein
MVDQTQPEIQHVQSKNKDRLYLVTNLEVKTNKLNKLKEIYTSTSQLDNISPELKKQFDDIILQRT